MCDMDGGAHSAAVFLFCDTAEDGKPSAVTGRLDAAWHKVNTKCSKFGTPAAA